MGVPVVVVERGELRALTADAGPRPSPAGAGDGKTRLLEPIGLGAFRHRRQRRIGELLGGQRGEQL